jgi:hypothetical protein
MPPSSSFETLISDLADDAVASDVPPRPPHPFSINSLEAAWGVAATARALPHQDPGGVGRRMLYSDDDGGTSTEMLLDPNKILSELGLHSGATEEEIALLRREFALRNHPDRVPAELRDIATRRMMIANDLMDRYVERLRRG